MTENKRFTFGGTDEEPLVRDNITGKEYPTEENSLMELLNELHDENVELKQDLKLLQDSLWTTEIIRNLEKKNEQLKQQNKGLRETIERQNDWEKKAITEIEQLKQQIQQLKQWNKCLAEKRHNELKGDVK